eukprot:Gb_41249 [translate_table: standard]
MIVALKAKNNTPRRAYGLIIALTKMALLSLADSPFSSKGRSACALQMVYPGRGSVLTLYDVKGKPIVHPAKVDLKGRPYELLMHNATRFSMDDLYRNPCPLQPKVLSLPTKVAFSGRELARFQVVQELGNLANYYRRRRMDEMSKLTHGRCVEVM